MKTKFYYLFALLAMVFMSYACTEEDNPYDEPKLTVSSELLSFANDGGNEVVKIETNKDNWTAYSAQEGEWLNMEVQGDNLLVMVEKNKTNADRQSAIMVNSMGASKKIVIKQSAGDVYLNVALEDDEPMEIGGSGDAVSYKMQSNAAEIKVLNDTEWLKVEVFEKADMIQIRAEENTTGDKREGKFTLKSGDLEKTFAVVQLKKSAAQDGGDDNKPQPGKTKFAWPFTGNSATVEEVKAYEASVGHEFLKEMDLGKMKAYAFKTQNKRQPTAIYIYGKSSDDQYMFVMASINGADGFDAIYKGQDFQNEAKAQGYEFLSQGNDGSDMYSNKEGKIIMNVSRVVEDKYGDIGSASIMFMNMRKPTEGGGDDPVTPGDTKFAWPFAGTTATIEEVKAYEQSIGHKFLQELPVGETGAVAYAFSTPNKRQGIVFYVYNKKGDNQYANVMANIKGDDGYDSIYKGQEFQDELKSQGYKFLETQEGTDIYKNESKKIQLQVSKEAKNDKYLGQANIFFFNLRKPTEGGGDDPVDPQPGKVEFAWAMPTTGDCSLADVKAYETRLGHKYYKEISLESGKVAHVFSTLNKRQPSIIYMFESNDSPKYILALASITGSDGFDAVYKGAKFQNEAKAQNYKFMGKGEDGSDIWNNVNDQIQMQASKATGKYAGEGDIYFVNAKGALKSNLSSI